MGFWSPPEYPLRLTVAGHPGNPIWVLPDPGTAGVLEALESGSWASIVPGLLDLESVVDVGRRWSDPEDPVSAAVLCRLAAETTLVMTGVGWHVAAKLVTAVNGDRLDFHGWCARHGFDPDTASVHRWLGAAYGWLGSPLENAGAMADPKELDTARRRFADEVHRGVDVPALYDQVPDDDGESPRTALDQQSGGTAGWSRQEEAMSFENTMAVFSRFSG